MVKLLRQSKTHHVRGVYVEVPREARNVEAPAEFGTGSELTRMHKHYREALARF
jgi:hypothetical protein